MMYLKYIERRSMQVYFNSHIYGRKEHPLLFKKNKENYNKNMKFKPYKKKEQFPAPFVFIQIFY